jgi:hypothetical protein
MRKPKNRPRVSTRSLGLKMNGKATNAKPIAKMAFVRILCHLVRCPGTILSKTFGEMRVNPVTYNEYVVIFASWPLNIVKRNETRTNKETSPTGYTMKQPMQSFRPYNSIT